MNFSLGSETGCGKSLLLLAARKPGGREREREKEGGISIGLPVQLTTYCSVISPSHSHTGTHTHKHTRWSGYTVKWLWEEMSVCNASKWATSPVHKRKSFSWFLVS